METKKVHTKSRRGCTTCKTRKIKCDEVHPLCGQCSRKFPERKACEFGITFVSVSSEYPQHKTTKTTEGTASVASSSASAPPTVDPSAPIAPLNPLEIDRPFTTRSLELKLWHHWINITSQTMPPHYRKEANTFWGEQVSAWAVDFEYLLDALMGITALHVYTLNPTDHTVSLSADFYNGRAAAKYRDALSDINQTTAGPIVTTALLIAFMSKIVPRINAANKPYQLPLELFFLQRGIQVTQQEALPYIRETLLFKVIFGSMPVINNVPAVDDPTNLTEDAIQDTANIRQQMQTEQLPFEGRAACESALSYVLAIHRGLNSQEGFAYTGRRVTAFPVLIPWGFVELLQAGSISAMLILARWYAIMKLTDCFWWCRGTPEYEVRGIASLIPRHLQWLMDYPNMTLQNAPTTISSPSISDRTSISSPSVSGVALSPISSSSHHQ